MTRPAISSSPLLGTDSSWRSFCCHLLILGLSLSVLVGPIDAQTRKERRAAKKAAEAAAAEIDDGKWDVANAPGPGREVTIETTEGTWMNLDVSPDGSTIVFDLLGDLFLLPIEGGEATAITSGSAWDMQPRFSPDGSEIAFTSDRDGGDNIWVIGTDGGNARQISKESFRLPNHPAWSPDGEFIAARKHFSSRRSLGSGEIWLWHRSGEGSGLKLNDKPNEQKDFGEPAFSPDGRYVYISQDTTPGSVFQYSKDSNAGIYSVRRIDRQNGEIETVISGPGGAVAPTPSPDGTRLAFVRRVREKTALFVRDLESGRNRMLFDGLDRDMQEIWAIHGVYTNYAWTPDSSSLVIWAGGGIHRIDAGSGERTEIPFRVQQTHFMKDALRYPVEVAPSPEAGLEFDTRMLRWAQVAPTMDRVVFQAVGRLWIRSIERDSDSTDPSSWSLGPAERLTSDGSGRFEFYPRFSRDGRHVVYSTWDDEALGTVQVVAAEAGSSPRTVVAGPGHFAEVAVAPDGGAVVYRRITGGGVRSELWSSDPGLYRIWTDPQTLQPLADAVPVRLGQGLDPHFGADADRVFYTAFGGGKRHLESRSLDGGPSADPQALDVRRHASSTNATEFRVSPNGSWIAYSERFQARLVPLVDASEPLELSERVGSVPFRTLSRDAGEWLHWSGDDLLLWTTGPELFGKSASTAVSTEAGEFAPMADGLDLGFSHPYAVPEETTAFINAKILTMAGPGAVPGADDEGIIESGTVLVQGNRILTLGPSLRVPIPEGARQIDATGKVLMPGYIDVHWHGPQGSAEIQPQANWENYATLAFGVTTVHDPSNDTSTFFAASELQKAGEIVAPRLFSTGTILYGAAGSFKAIVDDVDDAREHLRRLKAAGAFSVKSYNQPRRDQRQMIVAAARELEMMVVNEGGATFQHNMTMVLDGHTGIEHSLAVGAIYDDVKQFWGASEVGNTPTLVVAFGGIEGERYWYQHTDVYDHPRLTRFVPRPVLDARSRRRIMAPDEDYNHFRTARVCADLHDAGVLMLVGAHGQREGLAAHWEMWMLEQGGMSPMEVLRAATIDGARYLGLDGDVGSIAPGKLADLILLDEDPLVDLRNSESLSHVMVNGRLYDAWTMNEVGGQERPSFWWEDLGLGSLDPSKP